MLIGDTYSPISGATTRALSMKCVELEAKIELLRERLTKLEKNADDVRARVKLWMPAADL